MQKPKLQTLYLNKKIKLKNLVRVNYLEHGYIEGVILDQDNYTILLEEMVTDMPMGKQLIYKHAICSIVKIV